MKNKLKRSRIISFIIATVFSLTALMGFNAFAYDPDGDGYFDAYDLVLLRTCPHRKLRTSFRRILPMSALKKLTIRQYAFTFSSCPRQNYARKSAHNFYVDRFLFL